MIGIICMYFDSLCVYKNQALCVCVCVFACVFWHFLCVSLDKFCVFLCLVTLSL